jgi:hypothetical protein
VVVFNLVYTRNDDFFEWSTHIYLVILVAVDIVILDYAGNLLLESVGSKGC